MSRYLFTFALKKRKSNRSLFSCLCPHLLRECGLNNNTTLIPYILLTCKVCIFKVAVLPVERYIDNKNIEKSTVKLINTVFQVISFKFIYFLFNF